MRDFFSIGGIIVPIITIASIRDFFNYGLSYVELYISI